MNKIRATTWNEIKDQIKMVNKELFLILTKLDLKNIHFFLGYYNFGEHFGIRNHALLPDMTGKMVRMDSDNLDNELVNNLGYGKNSLPLGLILDKYCEWHYCNEKNRIFPEYIQGPGAIFNMQIIFDEAETIANNVWSVSSGALSSFLLPNIGCNRKHARIQKYFDVAISAPKSPFEHYRIFNEILQNQILKTDWESKILYFSKQFVDEVKNNPLWLELKLYFSESLRKKQTNNPYNPVCNDLFLSTKKVNKFRPTPFVIDTAKYIFNICMGSGIGVKPAKDEQHFPVKSIQDVYTEYYGLEYIPTVMVPATFDRHSENIYYPLQCPFSKINTFKTNLSNSTLTELETLKNILLAYQDEFLDEAGAAFGTPLYEACKRTEFSFYHYQASGDNIIRNSLELPVIDNGFLFGSSKENACFSSDAKLFRGCVRLSNIE